MTLKGNIIISVGLFGHDGDAELWENMDESTRKHTKMMLDDMHKERINMADSIFVINPQGYIGKSTWSEICYAWMIGKKIEFLENVSDAVIKEMVVEHIKKLKNWHGNKLTIFAIVMVIIHWMTMSILNIKEKK